MKDTKGRLGQDMAGHSTHVTDHDSIHQHALAVSQMAVASKKYPIQATWQDGVPILGSPLYRIVNVASIPMRSPFRYPGGKTWLIPSIRRWLGSLPTVPEELVEPFAGGGIVGLTAAFEQLANHVTLVELDQDVAAVWRTMLSEDGGWLAEQVVSFSFSEQNVDALLRQSPSSLRERAFMTLVRNRINRGGILAPGAGRIKNGENGKGIASRWYPETLQRRILEIHDIRQRLTFIPGDGLLVLRGNVHRKHVAYFIDPPYTAAGKKAGLRLYRHANINHEDLFDAAERIQGDFLMTYDDTEEILHLARHHGFQTVRVPMKSTHHSKMTEVIIGRDLSWATEKVLPS
jgi:DNA adenine methylase